MGIEKTPEETAFLPLSYTIKVNGNELDSTYQLIKVRVDKEVNKISRAKVFITGGDPYLNTFDESEEEDFKPGTEIIIELGYKQENKVVFKGIIEKLRIKLQEGFTSKPWRSLLILEAADKAIKLTNSYTTDIYEDKLDSELFLSLTSQVSGLSTDIEDTNTTHAFLPKYNTNDWEFIVERAKLNSQLVLNSNNKLTVKKPVKSSDSSLITIINGESTISFDGQINAANQLSDMTVNSWDIFKDETITSAAEEPSLTENETLKASEITDGVSASELNFSLPHTLEQTEVKEIANAYLQYSRLNRVIGTSKFKGVNTIDIGTVATLKGFGKNFDGKIYITKVAHELESGKYTTEIGFGIPRNFFDASITDFQTGFKKLPGLFIATVKKVDADPLDQNRIQVQIPSIKDTGDGIWARLTHFYTSSEAGSFFIPEVDSQVVLSFIGEDPRFPVILGGLYTDTNKPYKTVDDQNNYKAFLSKSKLTLEFDDENKKITLSTPENNSIVIDESAEGITITDQNENEIKTSPDGITITSKKDITLTASGAINLTADKGVVASGKGGDGIKLSGNNVALEAQSKLTAKGGSGVDINASGQVNVKGSAVNIN